VCRGRNLVELGLNGFGPIHREGTRGRPAAITTPTGKGRAGGRYCCDNHRSSFGIVCSATGRTGISRRKRHLSVAFSGDAHGERLHGWRRGRRRDIDLWQTESTRLDIGFSLNRRAGFFAPNLVYGNGGQCHEDSYRNQASPSPYPSHVASFENLYRRHALLWY